MKTLNYNGHTIEAPGSTLSGMERVRYNGELVSSKWSILGAEHTFEAVEDGSQVEYLVSIGTRWHGFGATCMIYRNDELLFSDR